MLVQQFLLYSKNLWDKNIYNKTDVTNAVATVFNLKGKYMIKRLIEYKITYKITYKLFTNYALFIPNKQ